MMVLFILELACLLLAYVYSRNRYNDFLYAVDKKKYTLRVLLPSALLLVDIIKSDFLYSYERKLAARIAALHGNRNVKHYLRLHLANKLVLMYLTMVMITLLGIFIDKPDFSYFIFLFVVLLLIFYFSDREIEEKIKKKNFILQYDFPEFLNKLVLLINAGMTVSRAWGKIVCDKKATTPLYEELKTTYIEIMNGKPETAAYEDFAKRCRVKEITKFITVIIQNQRKGNGEMIPILKLQSNECWQTRKNMAKKLGEEASTKLIFPLMIMFVGILIIVLTPAVLQLRSI